MTTGICPICETQNETMGMLGNIIHFRCRSCGTMYYKENFVAAPLDCKLFRDLNKSEEAEFRRWARENWEVGQDIKSFWHPVVQNECLLMEEEEKQKEEVINTDGEGYEEYVRIPFPDYQELMGHPDWVERTAAIGDSDILVPKKWVE